MTQISARHMAKQGFLMITIHILPSTYLHTLHFRKCTCCIVMIKAIYYYNFNKICITKLLVKLQRACNVSMTF